MQATFVCLCSILTDDPAIFKKEYLGVSNLSVDGGGDNARQIELPKVRSPYKYFGFTLLSIQLPWPGNYYTNW